MSHREEARTQQDAVEEDAVTQDGRLHEDAVLLTPRLVMRPLLRHYVADLVDLYGDPAVTRFLKPLDHAGHLRRCEEAEEMWASRGFGRVAVHDRVDDRFLGRSGLQYWSHLGEVELTWALRRDAWGNGYATEAAAAWLAWALRTRGLPYVTAMIDPQNTASRAVAERVGMTVLRTDEQHGRPVIVYAAGVGGVDLPAEDRSAQQTNGPENRGRGGTT
ncbi:GNAT family N-acetyltransferase [Modestobacter muralis]|uniref:GNAT family N-acetyltransferase n=1 Tax=Modestobacter muralis TaxID=1608614 RepID=A0A6P0EVY6_9ACTN|nr:GNAT family N-acetyltransferase [Modestobacter muralis]NEK95225.1 GNAT family N-acetyltransferase [Modestobacter muralis]NEN52113.1 GNAT family N-acetyltransferase [Modestobacter muralis]